MTKKLGRPQRFDPKSKIVRLIEENPRRKGTKAHKNFNKMKNNITVASYKTSGGCLRDLRYSVDNGWIKIED